jgi:hypothetical protein
MGSWNEVTVEGNSRVTGRPAESGRVGSGRVEKSGRVGSGRVLFQAQRPIAKQGNTETIKQNKNKQTN